MLSFNPLGVKYGLLSFCIRLLNGGSGKRDCVPRVSEYAISLMSWADDYLNPVKGAFFCKDRLISAIPSYWGSGWRVLEAS